MSAIVFGVTGYILSGGFVEDIFVQLREVTIHSQLGHVQLYASGYFSHGRRNPYQYMIEDPQPLIESLQNLRHLEEILARVQFAGLASTGRADLPIVGEGVEPDKETRLGTFTTITAGRNLTDTDAFGILLGEGVANSLDIGPGDFITLLVNTPEGALNSLDFDVIGVFRTFSKDYDNRAVRIPLAAAQELMFSSGVHTLVFSLDETEATDEFLESLDDALGPQEFDIRPWYSLADFYNKTVALYRRQFGVLQVIILVMIVLSVANSVNMAIFERVGEFGTQMALGARRREIFGLVVTENVLLGLLGGGLGVALGMLLAWAISQVGIPMPPPPNSNSGYIAYIRLNPLLVTEAFLLGVVATTLAAILPGRKASNIPVVDALRQNV